jgi:hypothetical protein
VLTARALLLLLPPQVHGTACHVVYTDYRPTPLQHYVFPQGERLPGAWPALPPSRPAGQLPR